MSSTKIRAVFTAAALTVPFTGGCDRILTEASAEETPATKEEKNEPDVVAKAAVAPEPQPLVVPVPVPVPADPEPAAEEEPAPEDPPDVEPEPEAKDAAAAPAPKKAPKKTSKPKAKQASRTTGPIGIRACDEYIRKYKRCVQEKLPEAARAATLKAVDQTVAAWKQAAAGPGRDGLAQTCKSALATAKKATAPMGCKW